MTSIMSHSTHQPIKQYKQWRKFTFSDGGAKPSNFSTKLSNFRQPPPPPFALKKTVFRSKFPKIRHFPRRWGGGHPLPRPTEIYATEYKHESYL
jgi:hypothetical protein